MGSFLLNDTATTEIYTLSLHDALPIYPAAPAAPSRPAVPLPPATCPLVHWRSPTGASTPGGRAQSGPNGGVQSAAGSGRWQRSEEHTSELQSRQYLVCRLLLEKKEVYV